MRDDLDSVLTSWKKVKLIHEVIRLRTTVEDLEERLFEKVSEIARLNQSVADLTQRDSSRYDALLEKQTEILDARLGLTKQEVKVSPGEHKPIQGRRNNFGRIRADFEKRQREAHWVKVIADHEARDKAQDKAAETKNK